MLKMLKVNYLILVGQLLSTATLNTNVMEIENKNTNLVTNVKINRKINNSTKMSYILNARVTG